MATRCLVDVMVHIRKASLKYIYTFGEIIERILDTTNVISPQANRRDYVFDSPKDGSIKDSLKESPIGLEKVKIHTPLPRHGVLLTTKQKQSKNTSTHVHVRYNQTACIRKCKPHGRSFLVAFKIIEWQRK